MSERAAGSHYDTLGVSSSASHDDVRRAYITRARETHPDRYIDASTNDRLDAERRMREINEAWRILGNARRRRRYDLEREPERRFATRPDGTVPFDRFNLSGDPDDLDVGLGLEEIDMTTRLIRGLPWMILVVVLFAIFVFTAYAVTGGQTAPRTCVTTDGTHVTTVDCGTPGARRVVTTITISQPQSCPAGTERLQPPTGAIAYCLEV